MLVYNELKTELKTFNIQLEMPILFNPMNTESFQNETSFNHLKSELLGFWSQLLLTYRFDGSVDVSFDVVFFEEFVDLFRIFVGAVVRKVGRQTFCTQTQSLLFFGQRPKK